MSTPGASSSPAAAPPNQLPAASPLSRGESVVTAKRSGVPARGHPVQLDRIMYAEHEVEDPSAVHVEPVVGQLLTAVFFFFNDTATTEIYTLSLHDALPI